MLEKNCRNTPAFLFISYNASSQPAVATKKDIEMKKKEGWIVYSIAQIAFIIGTKGDGLIIEFIQTVHTIAQETIKGIWGNNQKYIGGYR